MKLLDRHQPAEIRRRLGLNQEEFLDQGIGRNTKAAARVTKAAVRCPSRFASCFGWSTSSGSTSAGWKKEDFEIIDHLKSQHPDLYQSLRKATRKQAQEARGIQAGIQLARNVHRWAGGLVRRRNISCAVELGEVDAADASPPPFFA